MTYTELLKLEDLASNHNFDSLIFDLSTNIDEPVNEIIYLLWMTELQKWFREEHKLHIAIYPIKDYWLCDVRDCCESNNCHASMIETPKSKTFEDSLMKGLYKAFDYIIKV